MELMRLNCVERTRAGSAVRRVGLGLTADRSVRREYVRNRRMQRAAAPPPAQPHPSTHPPPHHVTGTATAKQLLGSEEEAVQWLSSPVLALGGQTPLSFLGSDAGSKIVEDTLFRSMAGICA